MQAPLVAAQQIIDDQARGIVVKRDRLQALPMEKRANVTYDTYILGPGDGLKIELLDLPELSGTFSIGPDGTLYLPRLRLFMLRVSPLRSCGTSSLCNSAATCVIRRYM